MIEHPSAAPPYPRDLTYGSEDRNGQPCRVYLINNFNISKTSNKYPPPSPGAENWLCKFEEVHSIYQTFRV